MNMMNVAKRLLVVFLSLSAVVLCAVAGNQNNRCPLPVNANNTSSPNDSTQSPEHQACMRRVLHNGMTICLPCPAADAHVRVHHDADLGPCDKPGNETPPGRS